MRGVMSGLRKWGVAGVLLFSCSPVADLEIVAASVRVGSSGPACIPIKSEDRAASCQTAL